MWEESPVNPRVFGICSLCITLVACGDESAPDTEEVGRSSAPLCTEAAEVACTDQAESTLSLNPDGAVAPDAIVNTSVAGVFTSTIDATAGGARATPPGAYVYARFTDEGLEQVALSDDEALGSMDWDIAFQRFRIRLNSGDSGPSCTAAAMLPDGEDFVAVRELDESLSFATESFYDDSCAVAGEPGFGGVVTPSFVLDDYYEYTSCVSMTGRLFGVQLANGRQVKLTVNRYYEPSAQEGCDSGVESFAPVGSANLELTWAFLN